MMCCSNSSGLKTVPGHKANAVLVAAVVAVEPGALARSAAVKERSPATAGAADWHAIVKRIFDFEIAEV